MKEVQNKWNTLKLNDDIWAKLIYFEQNRRLAKAYVSAPVLTVDGSTHGLDGFRIGLSGIDNTYRSLDSMGCLRSIGHGIKLKIDHHGNILIRKLGTSSSSSSSSGNGVNGSGPNHNHAASSSAGSKCSVWVKEWPSINQATSGGLGQQFQPENCMMREIEELDVPYKLFDMRSFRLQLEKRRLNNENINLDWRQCVSIISFVKSTSRDEKHPESSLLEDPCWIMLINIIAIDMIKSSLSLSDEDPTISRLNGFSGGRLQNPPLPMMETSMLNANHRTMGNHHRSVDGSNNRSNSKGPYRTSSSSSILFPQSDQGGSYNNRNGDFSSGTDSTSNNLLITNERIKKLRTSSHNNNNNNNNNHHHQNRSTRLSSMKSNYPRRYQSIQQLSSASEAAAAAAANSSSANSTIYTTFNGKFANNGFRHHLLNYQQQYYQQRADNSSTSDYNSGSRSSGSQNYWRKQQYHNNNDSSSTNNNNNNNNNQLSYAPLDALHQRLHSHSGYKQQRGTDNDGRVMFSRKSLLPPPIESDGSGNNNKSLSALDLSHQQQQQQQRGLELRSMHSSIRMNYDYLSEAEDDDDDDDEALEDYEDDDVDEVVHNNDETEVNMNDNLNPELLCIDHQQLHDAVVAATSANGDNNNHHGDDELEAANFEPTIKGIGLKRRGSHSIVKSLGTSQVQQHYHQHHNKLVSSNNSNNIELKSASPPCCCIVTDSLLKDTIIINDGQLNECKANHQKQTIQEGEGQTGSGGQQQPPLELKQQQQQQKLGATSLTGSTSSSSGCVDHDYFMSHSTSSMSSSTASNERELFSQPASSSGIVCSAGSTSDEYDEEGKKQHDKVKTPAENSANAEQKDTKTSHTSLLPKIKTDKSNLGVNGPKSPIKESIKKDSSIMLESQRKHKQKKTIAPSIAVATNGPNCTTTTTTTTSKTSSNRRAFHKKTIDNSVQYCCDHTNIGDQLDGSNSCSPVEFVCNCCCDCFMIQQQNLLTTQSTTKTTATIDCGCRIECTDECPLNSKSLLRKSKSTIGSSVGNVSSNGTGKTKKRIEFDSRLGQSKQKFGGTRISSLTKIDDISERSFGEISTIPMQHQADQLASSAMEQTTNNKEQVSQKQQGGWRGYSRIFPKFMFPSSANNNRQTQTIKDKSRSKKNGMVRLTRSTQDLS